MWTELRWLNKGANGGVIHIFDLFDSYLRLNSARCLDDW